jgi:large subunit ribosomal protein L10
MPKSKLQKQEITRDMIAKIGRAKSIVFASFNALTVKDNEELRLKLRAENSEYYVAKKTLLNLAMKEGNFADFNVKNLSGKVAAVFSYEDEVAPAKIVHAFRKDREDKIFFVGGILENRFISKAEVESLALLPSKTQLYGQLVGSLNAPISGFVNVLAGNLRGLATVLQAIADQKA